MKKITKITGSPVLSVPADNNFCLAVPAQTIPADDFFARVICFERKWRVNR